MRPLRLTAAAALTLPIAACTMTPATTPTPVPTTYQCTPEAGGAPYTCTEAEHQEMVKKDALYAEAEQVYRAFYAVDMESYRVGGEASDEALAHTVGEGTDIVREAHADGTQFTGDTDGIVWVHRTPGVSRAGSVVAIEACLDHSSATVQSKGSQPAPGAIAQERAYFSQTKDGLKISYFEFHERESC